MPDIYISELTIVEMATALADDLWREKPDATNSTGCTVISFETWPTEEFRYGTYSREISRTPRTCSRFAKVISGRDLKSSDAIVAESCRELAYELGRPVTFYLCDQKLHKTLSSINAYSSAVRLRLVRP